MGNTKLYIPITIVSFILIVYSLLIFVADKKYTPSINYSLKFDTIIHHNYSRPLSLTLAEELSYIWIQVNKAYITIISVEFD